MGRTDPFFHPAPVRISRAAAAGQQSTMLLDAPRLARGAGNYGEKELRFDGVPLALRIDTGAGPNTQSAQAAAKPMGPTRRKRGYPPVTLVSTSGE